MIHSSYSDPVPAITEQGATGVVAEIFADIRGTLDVEVVNLIWRHLATMPGALEWVWGSLKPLYQGPAIGPAEQIRTSLPLPSVPAISRDTLLAAGIGASALSEIRGVLDSYQHTNALALVCFSAFIARYAPDRTAPETTASAGDRDVSYARPDRVALPRLIAIAEMPPALARLVQELNGFGEDTDSDLVASMYRHLAHWPVFLSLVRTLLVPLHQSGELTSVVAATRKIGEALGARMAREIVTTEPPLPAEPIFQAVRRFVRHPIARMTGVCAIISRATTD
ncbi:hypothetical protein [Bradyrhizobium elkanii]|jgi:hypothetical protein|uniref:hypothetical protein n=1 Tax=Bradyrhizobium elkanii TaxID=29448 RepID=UPI00216808B0|nr:hypothetical protein [Bradyrhizobium elkanii]MCS3474173.1 hypothetical protein [Bradyrhizobium elkanii]